MSADLSAKFVHLINILVTGRRLDGNTELLSDRFVTQIKKMGKKVLVDRLGKPNYALIGEVEKQFNILFDSIHIDPVGCLLTIKMNTRKGFIRFDFQPPGE